LLLICCRCSYGRMTAQLIGVGSVILPGMTRVGVDSHGCGA
jgi:hypothetical protein